MTQRLLSMLTLAIVTAGLLTGCTVHPRGEQEERRAAIEAGKPFEKPAEERQVFALPANPSPDDLVGYALQTNGDLERAYWEWRATIEQIPQDGTQATNLALSASLNVSRGSTGLGRSTIGAGNDPMADIVLPPKLSVAAHRALENARAAGIRFRKAQLDLRRRVLNAYCDFALTAELIRQRQAITQLLHTAEIVTEARNGTGAASQRDLLKARNEEDLSINEGGAMQQQLAAERAALNALLNRRANALLPSPAQLPAGRSDNLSDDQWLALVAKSNPEVAALARDIDGKVDAIALAKLQYLPDISIGASTDLKGIAQSLMGMATAPYLRHEAIDAAISQAEANLRSVEATRRQTHSDNVAQAVMDIGTIRDADRQLDLIKRVILPRAKQSVGMAGVAYETGQLSLLELLESQRSLIAVQRLTANLLMIRAKRLIDLETIAGTGVWTEKRAPPASERSAARPG